MVFCRVNANKELLFTYVQSRNQGPQALYPAVGRQERLWGTGILLPQDF